MKPTVEDVQQMVAAIFTVSAGLQQARKNKPEASKLALLQTLAMHGRCRPSELAIELGVHQSSITRQVQALEASGRVEVTVDPDDRRSCFVALTADGRDEVQHLMQVGFERFAAFVADWDAKEVRMLAHLLMKFEHSKATFAEREQHPAEREPRPAGRHWQHISEQGTQHHE